MNVTRISQELREVRELINKAESEELNSLYEREAQLEDILYTFENHKQGLYEDSADLRESEFWSTIESNMSFGL